MKFPSQGLRVEALKCFGTPTLQCFIPVAFFLGLICFTVNSSAQIPNSDLSLARSVSGQFIINGSPHFSSLPYRSEILADTNLIHLEPALLAIAAERFKALIWEQLGLAVGPTWRGKIFLTLSPARSVNDDVMITSAVMAHTWEYRVNLPDIVSRNRYARAMATVLLLEIANRANHSKGHSAELPPWLDDGLAQVALDEDVAKIILSAPTKTEKFSISPAGMENSVTINRLNKTQSGMDPLTSARSALQNDSALTFDQISWPTDDQENGLDGGVYLASAQLFVHELLGLKNGSEKVRVLLAQLPGCLNWQTAFYSAFHQDFQRPADVEKWWALRVINFAAHNIGSQWTLASSNDELLELLTVPVEIRSSSNSFPVHTQISLQDAIRSFTPEQCDDVLMAKLRDLELAQFRVAPPFAALTSGYCVAIADFLGDRRKIPRAPLRNASFNSTGSIRGSTSLDALKRQASSYQDINSVVAQYMAALRKNPQLGVISQTKTSVKTQPVVQSQPVVQTQPVAQSKSVAVAKPAAGGAFKKQPAKRIVTTIDSSSESGENNSQIAARNKPQPVQMLKRASVKDTLKKLDDLDLRRRELLARLNLNFTPRNLASVQP